MSELVNASVKADISRLSEIGAVANRYAANGAFADHVSRKAENTVKAQAQDLQAFSAFLGTVEIETSGVALQSNPSAWIGVTWGLVSGFVRWMLREGYATGTINRRLATVKIYAKLAQQTGAVGGDEYLRIKSVAGYAKQEAKRLDERRETTRISNKKSQPVRLSADAARRLKDQPDTPQGRRDALLMCLLLDHGLRAGEVELLKVKDVDLRDGFMYVDRPKVGLEDHRHKLSADTLRALRAWFDSGDGPDSGPLLRGSRKGGLLTDQGMNAISITRRVRDLGQRIGIEGLSAHDCRHYWATYWAGRVDTLRLQEAGGWSSLDMPRRYIERSRVANEGMA